MKPRNSLGLGFLFSQSRWLSHRRVQQVARHVIEALEARQLLSTTFPQQFARVWNSMSAVERHDLAVLEYEYPQAAAKLDADVLAMGLKPVQPMSGALIDVSASTAAKGKLHHARPHRPTHRPRQHRGKDSPQSPSVVGLPTYYYETLPQTLTFTFNEDVTSPGGQWNSALSLINLNTGQAVSGVTAAYAPLTYTLTYSFAQTAPPAEGNYVAILHGSMITDRGSQSACLIGSDGIAGHDYVYSGSNTSRNDFFVYDGDVTHDRSVNSADLMTVLAHFNTRGTYSQGDVNYDGQINTSDLQEVLFEYNTSLAYLSAPGTPTLTSAPNGSVQISWTASGSPNVTYDVYRTDSNGNLQLRGSGLGQTTFTDASVAAGTPYSYSIVACDSSGNSSYPSGTFTVTPATASIAPIPNQTFTAWQPQTLTVPFSDLNSFNTHTGVFDWGDGSRSTAITDETDHSVLMSHIYTAAPTEPGKLTLTDETGGVVTSTFNVQVNDAAPPGIFTVSMPDGIAYAGTDFQATVNVYDPNVSGSPPISPGWQVSVQWDASNQDVQSSSTPNTTFDHVFGAPGTYPLIVTATDIADPSLTQTISPTITIVALPAPPAPTGFRGISAGSTTIDLSWNASTGATSYELWRERAGDTSYTYIRNAPSASYHDTGLQPDTSYSYLLYAVGPQGAKSSASAAGFGTAPAAPTPLRVTGTATNSISLAWTPPAGVWGYWLYRQGPGDQEPVQIPGPGPTDATFIDQTLTNGAVYTYQILATNGYGLSDLSNTVTTSTGLLAPQGLNKIAVTTSAISLSWNATVGATQYDVLRQGPGDSHYTELTRTSGTTFSDSGLQAGSSYSYEIEAMNAYAYATSPPSVISAVTVPLAPAGLTVITLNSSSILVNWAASTGSSTYLVFREDPGGGSCNQIGSTTGTSFSDSGLAPSTTYAYEVEATNSSGGSTAGPVSGATANSAPSSLTYALNPGPAVTLNWAGPGGAVTAYEVFRSTDGGSAASIAVLSGSQLATTYVDGSVQLGHDYTYGIVAVWGPVSSAESNVVALTTAPATPTGLTASVVPSTDTVSLAWTASPGTTAYHIERSQDNGSTFTEIAGNVQGAGYSDSTVIANVTYIYRVRAERNGAFSGYSANSGTLTPPLVAPANLVVTGVAITGTESPPPSPNAAPSVPLSWSPSPGATGYHVERGLDGVNFLELTWQDAVTTTTYTDTTVLPGFTYTYRVRAEENGQFSGYSNATQATLAPYAPADVIAQYGLGGQVNLTWDNTTGSSGYQVLREAGGSSSFTLIGDSTGLSFSDNSALSGLTYFYEVVAFNNGGTSSPSTPVSPLPSSITSPTVVGRWIFYNNSVFDGNDSTANANDDAAIAPDKQALLPGQASTFANFTNYSRGINGIMVDIADLAGTPTASDFSFLVGDNTNPSTWTAAPAPASVLVRPGAGVLGSTRVEVTWADGVIRNQWLQVTVDADGNTGLTTPDVFYFGNLDGSALATLSNGQYVVTSNDQAAATNDPHGFLNPVAVWYPLDFNRDGKVDATDQLIARNSYQSNPAPQLQYLVGAPDAPYLVGAGGSPPQITIAWPAPSDPNVASYTVNRVDGLGNHQQLTGVIGTSFTDSNVAAGTSYTYTVVALDSSGDASIPSSPLTVTPSSATIQAIAGQSLTEGGTLSISTAFSDPNTSNRHTATVAWGDGTTSPATVSEANGNGTITASHPYPIGGVLGAVVTLIDQSGNAAAVSFTANVLPAGPSNLVASATSYNTISLSWTNNSPSATDFEIQQFSSSTSTWSVLDEVPQWQTSYVAGGLSPSQSYTFQIVADNGAGQSTASNLASATTQALPTPTISSQATAFGGGTVTGTTVQLSVGATDSGGGSDLIYTWATSSVPSGVQPPTFSDNANDSASTVTATFSAAGSYVFLVTITDSAGATANSPVTVNVQQSLTSIAVTPPNAIVPANETQQLTATAYDQFGNAMSSQPSFNWSVTSGGGSVAITGLFTAPSSGSSTIQAASGSVAGQAQVNASNDQAGPFKVTITGRAYEPGYSAAYASNGLSVTTAGWISASSPEAAVEQAISGSVTLSTNQYPFNYSPGNSTLAFPQMLGNGQGFVLLASDNELAAHQLTWNPSASNYTGTIGMWDGDQTVMNDWDFYWNVSVATPVHLNDIRLTDDDNRSNTLTDSASQSQPANFNIAQQTDGTAKLDLAADYSPSDGGSRVLWSITGGAVNGATSGNFGGANPQIVLNPGTGSNQYVLSAGVDTNGDGTLEPNEVTETVNVTATKFLIEQESFGADAQHANDFHPVRLDPSPTDFSAHDLTGPQWQDLDQDGTAGNIPGEINGPICYTRSGPDGFVTMTVKADIYAPGANANGNYEVKATIQGTNLQGNPEGPFSFNPVAATIGTLNNKIMNRQDTIITANLTGSNFHIPPTIRDLSYTITYSVSVNGGPWQSAGQAKTKCYVINASLPAYWTYNKAGNSTLPGKIDNDHNPLWTVLDIACRTTDGLSASQGQTAGWSQIITAIWNEFQNNVNAGVTDRLSHPMKYWGIPKAVDANPDAGTDTSLIANADGSCGAWASLLVDCLRAEGATAYVYDILPNTIPNNPAPPPGVNNPPNAGDKFFGFQTNAPGQGNTTVENQFPDHAVVELGTTSGLGVYDPSYGKIYPNETVWRNEAIAKWVWDLPNGQTDGTSSRTKNNDNDMLFKLTPD
jgi:fibronectin type 3 domain-containing protein